MAEIMKQVRLQMKDLNKEPVIKQNSNHKLEEAETSISMAKTIQKIKDDLKTSDKVMLSFSKTQDQASQSQALAPTKGYTMEKIMKNIIDNLKETEEMSKPLIQTKLKTQEKTFEASKLSPISEPLESFQILDQTPSNSPTEEKMKEIMNNIRKNLIKNEKTKSVFPSELPKHSSSIVKAMQNLNNQRENETGNMSE